MSRLIGYGPGEILDRMAILELKIKAAPGAWHFPLEYDALQQMLTTQGHNPHLIDESATPQQQQVPRWTQCWEQLRVIHAEMWQLENQMRAHRSIAPSFAVPPPTWCETVARCGLRLNELNEKRSGLIAQINVMANHQGGPEKIR